MCHSTGLLLLEPVSNTWCLTKGFFFFFFFSHSATALKLRKDMTMLCPFMCEDWGCWLGKACLPLLVRTDGIDILLGGMGMHALFMLGETG